MKGKITIALAAVALGALAAGYSVKKLWKQHYNDERARGDAEERAKQLYYHWLLLKQKGVSLTDCLRDMGVAKAAVLGLDAPGRRLIDELDGSDVDVIYAVERDNPSAVHETLDVLRLGDDPLPEADAIVVCTLYDFAAISNQLRRETDAKIIALEQLILNALNTRGLHFRDGVLNPLKLNVKE